MSPGADSAGRTFSGRTFRPHPFAGDDGSASPQLANALDNWAGGPTPEAMTQVVEALRTSRILVPLIAEAGDIGHTPDGRVVEKTQELSVVTVAGPDGHPVGVVFSDVVSMAAWRPDARPQPAEGIRAAAWALTEGVGRIVVNPGSTTPCVLRRAALQALVTGERYSPPWIDPEVEAAIVAGLADRGTLLALGCGWQLDAPLPPDLIVEVGVPAGGSPDDIRALHAAWGQAWSAHSVINQRVDGVRVVITAI